jgi:hypothetical protein
MNMAERTARNSPPTRRTFEVMEVRVVRRNEN